MAFRQRLSSTSGAWQLDRYAGASEAVVAMAREQGVQIVDLRFTDTRANKVFVTIECLYGFTVGKNDALKRIVKP